VSSKISNVADVPTILTSDHESSQNVEEPLEHLNQSPTADPPASEEKSTSGTGSLQESPNYLRSAESRAEQESYQCSSETSNAKTTVSGNKQDRDQVGVPALKRILERVQTGAKLIQSPIATYDYLDAEYAVGQLTDLYQKRIEQLTNELRISKNELAIKKSELQQQVKNAVHAEQERLKEEYSQAIEARQNEHKKWCEQMETSYNNKNNDLQAQLSTLKSEKGDLQTKLSTLNSEKNDLQNQVTLLGGEKASMQYDHSQKQKQLVEWYEYQLREKDIEHERRLRDELVRSHETVQQQENRHSIKIHTLESNHKSEIEEMEHKISSLNEKITAMERQRHADLQQVEAIYQKDMKDMEIRYQDALRIKEQDTAREISTVTSEIERVKREAEEEKVQQIRKLKNEMKNMKINHVMELSRLRQDNEDLKGALVARVHNKGLSDHEVSSSFQKLALAVDRISREVQWDKSREATWPYPESVLRSSENIRRLKQHIIQNSIWTILYDQIFFTPFRVFAEEGKSLEDLWTKTFGQGMFYPFPAFGEKAKNAPRSIF
jgi:hypothetical protein